MNIVFMGTPDFAAKVLETLCSAYEIKAVVTGLDKPSGRGKAVNFSPVKKLALEKGIPVLQYEKVSKEGIADMKALAPDVVITAAFGQILSDEFLKIPKCGVINVHASLLPKYRGPAPIQWAVMKGEKETGITIMKTVKAVDAGDIILKRATAIRDDETAGELFERLSELGGHVLLEAMSLVKECKATYTPQDEKEATYFPMLKKEDGLIDFDKTPDELACFVRGVTPWPSAYTHLNGKMLKVLAVEDAGDMMSGHPGEVLFADQTYGLVVAAADGAVRLKTIQPENKKQMSDKDFLLGNKVEVGTILG